MKIMNSRVNKLMTNFYEMISFKNYVYIFLYWMVKVIKVLFIKWRSCFYQSFNSAYHPLLDEIDRYIRIYIVCPIYFRSSVHHSWRADETDDSWSRETMYRRVERHLIFYVNDKFPMISDIFLLLLF